MLLALMDLLTTNFDPKHMCKRCWVMLLRENIVINGITLTKHMLKELLGNSYNVHEDSLYPKDKQNVKSATSFLLAFIESVKKRRITLQPCPHQIRITAFG